jgi:hypothetical protein
MNTALAWINDLMTWLGKWVPRMLLIQPTHRGIRFGPRGRAKEVGPGLILYWPITHAVLQIPITTQSLELSGQCLPATGRGEAAENELAVIPQIFLVSAAVQFCVMDAVKAATSVLHLHALVDNRAKSAIARHFDVTDDWLKSASADLSAELAPYGVQLERLDLTQSGRGLAVKNVSDWSYSDSTNGTHQLDRDRR